MGTRDRWLVGRRGKGLDRLAQIVIRPNGTMNAVHHRAIDLRVLGDVPIRRVNHVECVTARRWSADLAPDRGPRLGRFDRRSDALTAEGRCPRERLATALGTGKLTLLVPVPVKAGNAKAADAFVDKPVCVCPATDDGSAQAIGVVMPLQPQHGGGYYEKLRKAVIEAERHATGTGKRRSRTSQRSARRDTDSVSPR